MPWLVPGSLTINTETYLRADQMMFKFGPLYWAHLGLPLINVFPHKLAPDPIWQSSNVRSPLDWIPYPVIGMLNVEKNSPNNRLEKKKNLRIEIVGSFSLKWRVAFNYLFLAPTLPVPVTDLPKDHQQLPSIHVPCSMCNCNWPSNDELLINSDQNLNI